MEFKVTVEGCTDEQAKQVMAERLGYDEDYGFWYTIKYEPIMDDFDPPWPTEAGEPISQEMEDKLTDAWQRAAEAMSKVVRKPTAKTRRDIDWEKYHNE